MQNEVKTKKEPLFHIVKRSEISRKKAFLIRGIAIAAALILSAVVVAIIARRDPFSFYASLLKGNFGSPRRIYNLLQGMAILLCISLAVTPAFRMKFWNCGAEGQVLMGGLATAACMVWFGNALPLPILLIVMFIASIAAGMIWAVIPAVCKALWKTNETLFTLMMNYVAIQLVAFALKIWVKDGSGVLKPMNNYGLPTIAGQPFILNTLIVAALTVACYIYLRYSKQGYEISVVGESENTARYIGINVKKVIIRTLCVSGAICGLAGFLLVGGTDHTINTDTVGGRGFTAIMVSWLAKFHPVYMVLTTFLVVFLERGAKQVATDFRMSEAIADILTAIILFFIIGCEFFINYKVIIRHEEKKESNV